VYVHLKKLSQRPAAWGTAAKERNGIFTSLSGGSPL
jgi:hypothetical protein